LRFFYEDYVGIRVENLPSKKLGTGHQLRVEKDPGAVVDHQVGGFQHRLGGGAGRLGKREKRGKRSARKG